MGTKNNPGEFDCYANAEPDEPMFILLARDPLAPALVRLWAEMRGISRPDTIYKKIREAVQCAESMELWKAAKDEQDTVYARERTRR